MRKRSTQRSQCEKITSTLFQYHFPKEMHYLCAHSADKVLLDITCIQLGSVYQFLIFPITEASNDTAVHFIHGTL